MTLLEAIDSKYEGELDLRDWFSVVFVTNEIKADAAAVRGIVTENIEYKKLDSIFFADVQQAVCEYENLPDFRIHEHLDPAAALRRFVFQWPEHVVLIGTNVNMWLKPLVKSLNEYCELFKGREVDIIDLGSLATATKTTQIRPESSLTKVLPPSRFNSKTGSLNKLCDRVGVYRTSFSDPVYAEVRARMLAEATRRNFDRWLEEPKD